VMLVLTLVGFVLAVLIPREPADTEATVSPGTAPATSQPTS